MTWLEEKLLYEAELCVTRCLGCGTFGHRICDCPENQSELDRIHEATELLSRVRITERKSSDRWIDVVLFVTGLVLGALLVSVMRG